MAIKTKTKGLVRQMKVSLHKTMSREVCHFKTQDQIVADRLYGCLLAGNLIARCACMSLTVLLPKGLTIVLFWYGTIQ